MSFIRIQGLVAGYGKSIVLRGVDLEVGEGESVAVVGKNGAGKSTLLNSFFGGTSIKGGRIEVGGVAIEKLPAYAAPKHGVSLSPQGRMILPHLTVQENLLLGAASGRPGMWTLQRVFELFPILKERRDKLGTALGANPSAVATLFGGTGGVARRLNERLDALLASDGAIKARDTNLAAAQKTIADDTRRLDDQMAVVQQRYMAQFTALDSLMSKLQSTSNYLTQQLANAASIANYGNNKSG